MTTPRDRWDALGAGAVTALDASIGRVRAAKREATQSLLGDTIAISDADWQEPSLLPGWTRAHVAAHLARNADALRRQVAGLLTLQLNPPPLYPDDDERSLAIEDGSRRGGLDLQIDLDTSANLLNESFDYLEESGVDSPVALTPRLVVPAQLLPLSRLSEVVLHHVDLTTGYTLSSLSEPLVRWLAAWELFRGADDPRVPWAHVVTDSGLGGTVGQPGTSPAPVEVRGPDANVLGWLSGRGDADALVADAPVARHLTPH